MRGLQSMKLRKLFTILVVVMAGLLLSCSETNRQTTPIEMIATVTQDITRVDLIDDDCGLLGTVNIKTIVKNADTADTRFLDVRLDRMAVSYQRSDGGSLVPASFTQTISGLITANSAGTALNNFIVFQADAFNQGPFAALFPNNGGLDAETGQPEVRMDVILDIFGETLSGENVSARARFPLAFCYNCGGCV